LLQRFPQFDAQKAACGVARDAGIESVGKAAHHRRILVQQLRQNREVVIVNDGVNAAVERAELCFDGFCNRLDVGAAAQREPLQIDKEKVLLRVQREALVEGNRKHVVA
jgi:hypothetical protein